MLEGCSFSIHRKKRNLESIKKELLDVLACPVSHAALVQSGDWLYSTDRESRRKYPIRDGIPIMLVDESEVVDVEEYERVMSETNRSPT